MSKNGHDQFLKIETHVLKVHINCEGCKERVRKLLKKIEGVYSVKVDTEKQEVMVSGSVDPFILVKKLLKSGKKAELGSAGSRNKLEQANANQIQLLPADLNTLNNQYMFPASYMNEIGNMRSFEDFPNQDTRMKNKVDTMINHDDLIAAKTTGNINVGENIFPTDNELEDDEMPSLVSDSDYQENGSAFPGLGGHEFDGMTGYNKHKNLPPLIMTNRQQQGFYFNYPSTHYMHKPHGINQAFSMSPSYVGYNPHSPLFHY